MHIFPLLEFEYIMPFPSGQQSSHTEISSESDRGSLVTAFSLTFGILIMICLAVALCIHLIWYFLSFLYLINCFLSLDLGSFQLYFLKYIVLSSFLFLLLLKPWLTWFILSHKPHMLLYLFIFFNLSFIYCSNWMISIILFSRSLMCSALFSLLFIAFNSEFILEIELSNFGWFLFIASSPLVQWSVFLSIIFLNFPRLVTSSFLNWRSSRLGRSVSLFALLGDLSLKN